jgi:sodium pump decarboxylase gamma subunit
MFSEYITIQEALQVTVISMTIVFFILLMMAILVDLLKHLATKEEPKKQLKEQIEKIKKKSQANLEDEDAMVAVLVASIDYQTEINEDVRLVSVSKIS